MRDIFAPVAAPPVAVPAEKAAPDFRSRLDHLVRVVTDLWGGTPAFYLEAKTAALSPLIAASSTADDKAWSAALDELRACRSAPHNIAAWMAAAVRRAVESAGRAPTTHTAREVDVAEKKHRAYKRIAAGLRRHHGAQ